VRRLPALSSLRAFEAAARHGSFKKAAAELAVTPTAISHQMRALEDYLGNPLFERGTRQVSLTPEAQRLFIVLRNGLDDFASALAAFRRDTKRASVTITATMAFTAKWLVPRVSRFQAAHPDIDLRLHASDEAVDLAANDINFAIRYGRGIHPGLRAEPLFTDHFAPVANPSVRLTRPADLARLPLIHFEWKKPDSANPTWALWFEKAHLSIEPLSHLRFTDESHAIQAAVAGQGVALLSLALVRDELAAGQLAQPFGPTLAGMAYHLVEPAGATRTAAVQAAMEWIMRETTTSTADRKIVKEG
jgi:LysR family transcriptional regulator, glycine cleavage system transcriptional activator